MCEFFTLPPVDCSQILKTNYMLSRLRLLYSFRGKVYYSAWYEHYKCPGDAGSSPLKNISKPTEKNSTKLQYYFIVVVLAFVVVVVYENKFELFVMLASKTIFDDSIFFSFFKTTITSQHNHWKMKIQK